MISIVIPVYNEEELLHGNILRLRQWLDEHHLTAEILIVDNGSTDKTPDIGRDLQSQNLVRYFRIDERTVGRAFALGVREAKSEWIVSVDADLSADLMFVAMAESLMPYADMIVGSKTLGEQKRSLLRILGSQVYLVFTQIFFQMTITDYSMSAKAYRRAAILPILDKIDRWTAYVFEITVWLHNQNKSIVQIGVTCDDHRQSRFNIWHEGFYRYAHLFKLWRRLKDPRSWLHRDASL
jgi:glycosyltransferase involved in cell wall biosynthesis